MCDGVRMYFSNFVLFDVEIARREVTPTLSDFRRELARKKVDFSIAHVFPYFLVFQRIVRSRRRRSRDVDGYERCVDFPDVLPMRILCILQGKLEFSVVSGKKRARTSQRSASNTRKRPGSRGRKTSFN